MSINPKARTECVEVLFNPHELDGLDALCKLLGMARSTYLRWLGNEQVRLNGSPASPPGESRQCRGAPVASRASAGRSHRVLQL
jgi:hypothetical protein